MSAEPVSAEVTAKRAVKGAFFGFFLDMADLYLPVVALAPAMAYFEPKGLTGVIAATIFYLVFGVTLTGRPIGTFIFGHYSDKYGRKKTTVFAIAGFGISTFLMALLPGYLQWGLAAIFILIALRLLNGICLGGQYTGATPLALEESPREKRGIYGGLIAAAYPAAYTVVSLVTLLMLAIAPLTGGVNSPYMTWGWRIPFFLCAIISIITAVWFNKSVSESHLWQQTAKAKAPLKELFSGQEFRNLIQVYILMSGLWLVTMAVIGVLPSMLSTFLKLSFVQLTWVLLLVSVVLFFGYLIAAVGSQRWGRRRLFILFGVLSIIVAPFVYYELLSSKGNIVAIFVWAAILELLTVADFGAAALYSVERFKTTVRSSGFGIGYSLSLVIPSFYSIYLLWLKSLMPYEYTQFVLVVLGGILTIIGALMGPETKDIEFSTSNKGVSL